MSSVIVNQGERAIEMSEVNVNMRAIYKRWTMIWRAETARSGVSCFVLSSLLLCSSVTGGCESARRVERFEAREPSAGGVMSNTDAPIDDAGDSSPNGGDEVAGASMVMTPNDPPDEPAPLIPGPPVWSRLTRDQYLNMVSDVLGVDASDLKLEPDTNPYLFTSIGAGESALSALGAERYTDAAVEVARRYFERPERLEVDLGCLPRSLEDGCADQLIRWLGLRLYRRPLTMSEVERWLTLANAAIAVSPSRAPEEDTYIGLQWALAGLLQAPQTLYRLEIGEPVEESVTRRYTPLEMASRLSFVLQDTSPDLDLLNLGVSGALADPETLEGEVDRLLESAEARQAVGAFFAQYLDLSRIKRVERDPARYPGVSPMLFEAMEREVRLLVDELVFRERGDIRALFKRRRAYVNSTLAAHYDLSVEGASPVIFEPVELGEGSPRVGVLGLGAFLTMNAHPTETSPTLRGKYIRERLLCQEVPPPPDDIDLNLEREPGEATTLRERLAQHRDDPACFGCHQFVDPPGLIFEGFDSVGRYRETLDGEPIDTSGDLDGVSVEGAAGLAELLADDPRLTRCMVRQLYRFAQGRLEVEGEEGELERLHTRFAQSGFRFRALLKALVLSEGFRSLTLPEEVQR